MLRSLVSACVAIALLILSPASFADDAFTHRPDVQAFIQKMVTKHHFNKNYLIAIFSQVKIRPQVISHIKKPLERESWRTYQHLFVDESRIKNGVKFWNKHAATLSKAEKEFGVPASIIVATIGVETKYGQAMGNYRVMDALTNLAFGNTSRSTYFRQELENFLVLSKDKKFNPLKIRGSYAGAIGQPQFMPSSYRYFSVNYSKSGNTDLINNTDDVIGSVANFYQKHGWKTAYPITTEAVLNNKGEDFVKDTHPNHIYSLNELIKHGVKPKSSLDNNYPVRIIELESKNSTEYWLGFHNFYVIKRYNPSDLYAMAVYQLSNDIEALKDK